MSSSALKNILKLLPPYDFPQKIDVGTQESFAKMGWGYVFSDKTMTDAAAKAGRSLVQSVLLWGYSGWMNLVKL